MSLITIIMFAILRHIRFSEPVIKWFNSYLCLRQQSVMATSGKSAWANNPLRVPQGSILGPLLYSLYTFSIGHVLKFCSYHLYADDLQIYMSCLICDIGTTINKINDDISSLCTLSKLHGLTINA